ncbi:hypothetical protein KJF94_08895 [Pseudomonas hormoni]|uniref:Site-specific integrase n=1 Tax=Pseudomonas hormoni TaxID=3093767 RepID=A0ABX8F1P0_9PSED|nr:hypothetical protein [Pseudomonas hormoni]QVW25645.1 hypothetical protein KJF94_08895 [Pseudomonas hormoni]
MPKATKSIDPYVRVDMLLKQARERNNSEKRPSFEARWLISGTIGSSIWTTTSPGSDEITTINFDRVLSDGSKLTDESNSLVLRAIQVWAFNLRMGAVVDSQFSPQRWHRFIDYSVRLSSWLVRHKERFLPEKYAFGLVTLDAIEELLKELINGGWSQALCVKERVLEFFHEATGNLTPIEILIDNPDGLSEDFKDAVISWLRSNYGYSYRRLKAGLLGASVSRKFLTANFGIGSAGMSANLKAFFRQFEPKLHGTLLVPARSVRRYPSQNTIGIAEIDKGGLKENHLLDEITFLSYFFTAHPQTYDLIPFLEINKKRIVSELYLSISRGSHTKLIPLTIGLHAINQAAKWVIIYGEAIISAAIYYAEEFEKIHYSTTLNHQYQKKKKLFEATKHQWTYIDPCSGEVCSLCDVLNIQTPVAKSVSVLEPDLRTMVEAFVGACAVLIAILKPIRNKELCNLKRDSLAINPLFGGCYLEHLQGKTGVMGINFQIARDIPSITARGIQLLQVLGSRLSTIYGDSTDHAKDLFYLPGLGFKKPGKKTNSAQTNRCIDRFCDLINIPLDKAGRRWYLRVHEMRKFFLLITNRHQGPLVNEALRHAAGHNNRAHLYAYIALDEYDDDYLRFESECVDEKLINLEVGRIDKTKNEGLVSLYDVCCKHFKVSSLSSINASDILNLLMSLRLNKNYEISTCAIVSADYDSEVLEIEFAIRIGSKVDESFHT